MNMVCLLGRLTADPELRHTQSQVAVTSFTIAVDRAYQPKGQEQRQADFINVVAWRQTAEFVSRYFRKGQRLALTGSLQSRRYVDKDGNNRTAYEVVADQVYFAESKSQNGGGYQQGFQSGYQPSAPSFDSQIPQYSEAPTAFATAAPSDFEEIVGDDDLPF
ncbi:MAG: single-stranded DNA-binding protein [Clostridia bacterium]|nr:single-stranded DNA-binding protein [Clostridia bacterium]